MKRSVKRIFKCVLLCAGIALVPLIARSNVAGRSAVAGMPLCFEPMAAPDADGHCWFVARGTDFQFAIGPGGSEITLAKPRSPRLPFNDLSSSGASSIQTRSVSVDFPGANRNPKVTPLEPLSGKVNYLIGADESQWRQGVPTYGRVRVQELYAGIDLVYYGNQRQLEYDFRLAAGTDPGQVQLRFHGADAVSVTREGAVAISLGGECIYQHQPTVYQVINGTRKEIAAEYRLVADNTIGFRLGPYDHGLPLVIDPVLSYSSYFGGNGNELALAVKVDAQGSIYVAGETLSPVFSVVPTNTPGFQKKYAGGKITGDAFVAKFDRTATNLIYFTYIGGRVDEAATDLAVDGEGHAFITGFTASPTFPTTTNALSRRIHGVQDPTTLTYPNDAFVTELSADGASLLFSTYLGGAWYEVGGGIAVDPMGFVYVTGYSTSTNFPTTTHTNTVQRKFGGRYDAFVAKFAPGSSNLVYSTYLGGTGRDLGQGIAVDEDGFAYVTGYTLSRNFPITNAIVSYYPGTNVWQTNFPPSTNIVMVTNVVWLINTSLSHLNGSTHDTSYQDAFVTKLSPEGRLVYSSYLGGFYDDYGYRIAVDRQRNAYVTGVSTSLNFPNIHSIRGLIPGWISAGHASYDSFLTKITVGTNGAAEMTYSILFGGSGEDVGWGVAVDAAGDAFVVGTTYSIRFPTYYTNALLRGTNAGKGEVFVTAFNRDASAVLYSDYLGGSGDDFGYGIAVDAQSTAYVVGRTLSTNFPVVPAGGALLGSRQFRSDGFLAKIVMEPLLFETVVGNQVQLSWPPSAFSYVLETNTSLSAAGWAAVPVSPVVVDGYHTLFLPRSDTNAFFRLRQVGGP